MGWNLPERVKRLSLDSYRYRDHDLEHLQLAVAGNPLGRIAGVAAWGPAEAGDSPAAKAALLLHGLYVAPDSQGRGIGTLLIQEALAAATAAGLDGLLVKAQAQAAGYFRAQGFVHLPVIDSSRDYPYRYWMEIGQSSGGPPS